MRSRDEALEAVKSELDTAQQERHAKVCEERGRGRGREGGEGEGEGEWGREGEGE